MTPTLCKHCHRVITWAEIKRSYAKSLKLGISQDLAKQLSPMHIKCVKLQINAPKIEKMPKII